MCFKPCKTNCSYIHYNQLPKNVKKTNMLSAVTKLGTKLDLTDSQLKQFEKKIKADENYQ